MSNQDPVSIYTTTTDDNGSSNNVISTTATNATGILIHKVVLRQTTNGSNAVSVILNDHRTVGSSATLIALSTNSYGGAAGDAYARYASESFDPPVHFTKGLSIDVTGTGVSTSIYYTRR